MQVHKVILIGLLSFAAIGTIANWILKSRDRMRNSVEEQTKIRIRQALEECSRRLVEQKEGFQKDWAKKMKELNSKSEEVSVKETPKREDEVLQQLQKENKKLSSQLYELTEQVKQYKLKMKEMANMFKEGNEEQEYKVSPA